MITQCGPSCSRCAPCPASGCPSGGRAADRAGLSGRVCRARTAPRATPSTSSRPCNERRELLGAGSSASAGPGPGARRPVHHRPSTGTRPSRPRSSCIPLRARVIAAKVVVVALWSIFMARSVPGRRGGGRPALERRAGWLASQVTDQVGAVVPGLLRRHRPARALRARLRHPGQEPGGRHPDHHRRHVHPRGNPGRPGPGHLPLRPELAAQREPAAHWPATSPADSAARRTRHDTCLDWWQGGLVMLRGASCP